MQGTIIILSYLTLEVTLEMGQDDVELVSQTYWTFLLQVPPSHMECL